MSATANHDETGICTGASHIRKCAFCLGIRLKDSAILAMQCPSCAIAKIPSAPQGPRRPPPTQPLHTIQADSKGPLIPSHGEGFRYQHTIIDLDTQYCDVFYTRERVEFIDLIKSWVINTNALFSERKYRILNFALDGCPENRAHSFRAWLREHAIILSIHYKKNKLGRTNLVRFTY